MKYLAILNVDKDVLFDIVNFDGENDRNNFDIVDGVYQELGWASDSGIQTEDIQRLPDNVDIIDLIQDARNQIQYLQEKFGETGSGNQVLAKLNKFLDEIEK